MITTTRSLAVFSTLLLSGYAFSTEPMDEESLEAVHIQGGDVLNVMGASAAGDVSQDQNRATTGETNTLDTTSRIVSAGDARRTTQMSSREEPADAAFQTDPEITTTGNATSEIHSSLQTNAQGTEELRLNFTGRVERVDVEHSSGSSYTNRGDYSIRALETTNNVLITPRN